MNICNFRGDLSDISAKTATLIASGDCFESGAPVHSPQKQLVCEVYVWDIGKFENMWSTLL